MMDRVLKAVFGQLGLMLVLGATAFLNCSPAARNHESLIQSIPENQKARWVSKVSKSLSLTPRKSLAELKDLVSKPDDVVLEQLLGEEDALDVTLDFHKFFAGQDLDTFGPFVSLDPDGKKKIYSTGRSRYALAPLNAAFAFKNKGDIFSFFDLQLKLPPAQFDRPYDPDEVDSTVTVQEQRRKLTSKYRSILEVYTSIANEVSSYETFCARVAESNLELDRFSYFGLELGANTTFNAQPRLFPVLYSCAYFNFSDLKFPEIAEWRDKAKEEILGLSKLVSFYEANIDTPVTDYDANISPWEKPLLDSSSLSVGLRTLSVDVFDDQFYFFNQNSSTNSNRKRGARALELFFCDDLTPVNFVPDNTHSKNRHASEGGCASCHFKLDPMAGVFKSIGAFGDGILATNFDAIGFDDGKVIRGEEFQNYLNSWKNEDGTWNTGWIRSLSDPSLNVPLNSPQDLLVYAKNSPIVSKCYVKRMAQYFLGKDQQIDPGYLDLLHRQFETIKTEKGTYDAYKTTIKSLLTSNTFLASNPNSKECYDFADDSSKAGLVPCSVRFLIEKNCQTCHDSSTAFGGLDLSSSFKNAQGNVSFVHKDEDGNQRSSKESFNRLVDRISSQDANIRMPLNSQLDDPDRVTLFKWFDESSKK